MDNCASPNLLNVNQSVENPKDLEYIFHPRSVAVAGVSADRQNIANHWFLGPLSECNYKGPIYPISARTGEIMGLKAYPSIKDIPGPVDYVIAAIPASSVPTLMEECVEKGIKVVCVYASGFGESEDGTEGANLEGKILEIASRGGIRIIGPNCMGIYCPSTGLAFTPNPSNENGHVGFLSQSGSHAIELIQIGPARGIHFSKVVSYGNAVDLNETDLLEYFAKDPETRIIAAYIEGAKDTPRFIKMLKKTASTKPVIVVKGGRTDAGTRAASSHTGSLAGSDVVWRAICKQTGVVSALDIEELADLLVTFSYMSKPRANNVGAISVGGGPSVFIGDNCEGVGLAVPQFPVEIRRRLKGFSGPGSSVGNPMDSAPLMLNPDEVPQAIRTIALSPNIDLLIVHLEPHFPGPRDDWAEMWEKQAESISRAGRECGKPVAVVVKSPSFRANSEMDLGLMRKYVEAGFPVYPSISRAANAIAKFIEYHKWNDLAEN